MYGYELDYGYEPATEGIGSFFEMVWEKIKQFADWIKKKMGELKLKIQRMTGTTTADQALKDSAEVKKKIAEIGDNIGSIIDTCSVLIEMLYVKYSAVAKGKEISKEEHDKINSSSKRNDITATTGMGDDAKYYNYSDSYKAKNGMDKIRDLSDAETREWNQVKQQLGERFAEQGGKADKVAADLKSLRSYGPLTKSATVEGYDSLRAIFNANGAFGQKWKKIKIAAEWSTGFIKESLNKVVKMYDVGVRATQAFGNRLSGGNFRDETGKKIKGDEKKETMSSYKTKNKVYNDKGNYNISTSRKAKDFYDVQSNSGMHSLQALARGVSAARQAEGNESALLERLYDMAYEDVMNDLAEQQYAMEAYDMVPGAYEFVDDLGYDPSLDFDV
jgi:hypothetical protein